MPTKEEEYIAHLSDVERLVLEIAKEHLETSFSIKKSIGFKEWMSDQTPA